MNRSAGTLCTIEAKSLIPATATVLSEGGFEVLCTYNWLNDGAAILVPGNYVLRVKT